MKKWEEGQGQGGKDHILDQFIQAKMSHMLIIIKKFKRSPPSLVMNEKLSLERLAYSNIILTATLPHQHFQASLT